MSTVSLSSLLERGDAEGAARLVALRCAEGTAATAIAADLLRFAGSATGDWEGVLVALADAVRAAEAMPAKRAGLPLAQVAALAAEVLRAAPHDHAQNREDAEIAALLEHAATAPESAGAADVVASIAELSAHCGPAAAAGAAGRVATALKAHQPSTDPSWSQHLQHLSLLADQWQRLHDAEDDQKAAKFQEPKFRRHLLDGDEQAAFAAMAKALAFGVPRNHLLGSVALAAAERALRFDPELSDDRRYLESWADVAKLLGMVAGVARVLARSDRPQSLGLLLTAAWQVNVAKAWDAPTASRYVLPEPAALAQTWDHGPEIAKIAGRALAGDSDAAIAALRGYLLMVLPVQPLCQQLAETAWDDLAPSASAQLLAGHALASGVELFALLGDHPHRELMLAASLRVATMPLARRQPHAAALAVLDQLDNMLRPTARAPRLWTSRG